MPSSSIEPTKEEKRNGWTAQALAEYYRQRERAALIRIFSAGRPLNKKGQPARTFEVQNTRRFKPLGWGRKK